MMFLSRVVSGCSIDSAGLLTCLSKFIISVMFHVDSMYVVAWNSIISVSVFVT